MKLKNRRQSKNVEDLRDKPVGPKGVLKVTKAKRAHETKTKLLVKGLDGKSTFKKQVKDVPSDQNTFMRNLFVNNARDIQGPAVGSRVKNAKMDAKPGKFEFSKKKKKK